MTRISSIVATLLTSAIVAGPAAHAASLEITLENVKATEGQVLVELFDSADRWNKAAGIDGRIVKVTSTDVSVRFDDLPEGTYAVRLFHDVDGNGKLATGSFGIPTEPYGFSNNAKVRFGPPKFDAAAFEIGAEDVRQTIRLK